MRRSLIATAAVGGTLALAASASAIQIPMGTSNATPYSGSGTPASIYSLYNAASNGLIEAQNLIVGANVLAASPFSYGTAVDANFTTKFTAASSLTATNVAEIGTDVAASANTSQMEMSVCVFDVYPTQTSDNSVSDAFSACTATSSPYLAAAATAYAPATTSGTIQNEVASAASSWPQLNDLVSNLGSVSSVLNSADSASVSSSGTVTAANTPIDYNVTVSAPSGGYFLPSAFTLTFPAGLSVNTALVGAEVNAAANGTSATAIAAVEANPTGTPIGTVTLTSPLADAYGGSNNQLVGKIYVVQTGASSGQGSVTQPYLELWFAPYIYNIGSFPSSLAFPLTLQFGLAATPLGAEPLPISSLAMSFPAATSPVKATTCTTLGTVTATATDDVANLAYEFGDTSDGVSSVTGTPAAVNLASTPTAVTDQCVATPAKVKNVGVGIAAGLTSGSPTVKIKVKTGSAFKTVTLGLPGGLKFVKSKKLVKEVSGAKIKSVRIAGGKLVIALKSSMKSETIQTKKGLISESKGLIKSIKKHKTKKLTFTVRAGSATLKVKVNA